MVKTQELIEGAYYIIKSNNSACCFGIYDGKIGIQNPMVRFVEISRNPTKKSAIELFEPEKCSFYEPPNNIPIKIIVNNIIQYIY